MINKDDEVVRQDSKQDIKQFQEEFDNLHEGSLETTPPVVNTKENSKPTKPKAVDVENYLKDTGIADGFELIFTELLMKGISPEDYFQYTASRLRDMGRKLENKK
jgi:hypothetical protein